ncbi:MAG: Holliday junction resolvase RuvX [Candidatus Wallbacteria bacterium]|nr:Holliday junction resolvase RuvX [Candidatus Wallbacteria bacterium]
MPRVLAVDPGTKRLGLALSDPSGKIAFPYEVVVFGKLEQALKRVRAIAIEEGVERIVVGLPVGLSGKAGASAEKARELASKLRQATGLEVVEWDERLTTVGAARAMHEGGVRAREQRGRVDKVAATLLLQAYLEGTAA